MTLDIADPASVGLVHIDGRKIELEALGEPVSILVGEHQLEVTRRDFEVQTERFSITRGAETVVTITYTPEPAEVESPSVVAGDPAIKPPSEEATGDEMSAPPVAADTGSASRDRGRSANVRGHAGRSTMVGEWPEHGLPLVPAGNVHHGQPAG